MITRDYKKFTAEDFIDDSFFIEWIRDHTPASEMFWNDWQQSTPANLDEMKLAKEKLSFILSPERISPKIGDEAEIWDRIMYSLSLQNHPSFVAPKSSGTLFGMKMKYWTAAASVIILLGTGYFYFTKKNSPSLVNVVSEKVIENDLLPGGNKAILTLGDGQQIILDSSENGNLASQGNISVIKLDDGRIIYKDALDKPADIVYNTISTPRGGQYQVELADGSKAWLNAASSLRFPTRFTGAERKVEVTGEVYFEIAKKAGVPFEVILANGCKLQVLGTHFNVMDYEDEKTIETTLLEGSVMFVYKENNIIIQPGQQVVLDENTSGLSLNRQVDLEAVMAWKNGKFYFKSADIESVMKQLSRWYDVDIEYKGRVDKKFEGSVSRDISASNIFKILEATGGVNFKIDGKKILVGP